MLILFMIMLHHNLTYIKVANYCSLLYNILYVCSVEVSKWTYANTLDDSLTTGNLTDMFY